MQHTHEQLFEAVSSCLRKMGDGSGAVEVGEETDPIKDLCFDSVDGLFFACALQESLGIEIPWKVNPFVDDARNRSRKVKDIVVLIQQLSAQETNHA